MENMFYHAENFNQFIGNWNVANVTNMKSTFEYALSFNQPINNWNIKNVNQMFDIFYGCPIENKYKPKFN